jgi:hypothetical protein
MRTTIPIVFGLFLCGLIISISIHKTAIHASFSLNQDYIAANLCIEKDIEGSTCNGNCCLQKQLNKTHENGQSDLINTPDHLLNLFLDQDIAPESNKTCSHNMKFEAYLSPYSSLSPADIFHPPRGL